MAEERNSGNFVSGLIVGALAGVTGMFLFGTKKGEKTLDKLKAKWEEIQPQIERELEEKGHQLSKSKKPFLQAMGEIVDYVVENLEESNKTKKKPASQRVLPSSTHSSSSHATSGPSYNKKVFFKKK